MAKAVTYTNEARLGYANPHGANPYLATSIASDAYRIGQWLEETGRSTPRDVRKSRGDTYHVNGMKVALKYTNGVITEIERIA